MTCLYRHTFLFFYLQFSQKTLLNIFLIYFNTYFSKCMKHLLFSHGVIRTVVIFILTTIVDQMIHILPISINLFLAQKSYPKTSQISTPFPVTLLPIHPSLFPNLPISTFFPVIRLPFIPKALPHFTTFH